MDFCTGALHRCIHSITHMVEDHAALLGVPPRFAASKMVEGDDALAERLGLNKNELETIEHSVSEMEKELGADRNAAMADMRYAFIARLCARTVKKPQLKEHARSLKLDSVLTHKYIGLPLFAVIMLAILWLTFGAIGEFLSGLLEGGIGLYAESRNQRGGAIPRHRRRVRGAWQRVELFARDYGAVFLPLAA
jgi:ferrous iron transport protein B